MNKLEKEKHELEQRLKQINQELEKPKVILNGFEMKQDGDIISFGCAKFHKKWFETAYGLLETSNQLWDNNRRLKSITLETDLEIDEYQLKQIVDNLK